MNQLMAIFIAAEEGPHRDDQGQVITHHWLLPERSELLYGTISSVIIFCIGLQARLSRRVSPIALLGSRLSSTHRQRLGHKRVLKLQRFAPPAEISMLSGNDCSLMPTPRPKRCWPMAGPGSSKRFSTSKPAPVLTC
jgi:hypothetical protein